MPIISNIGRRAWKIRLLIGTIYGLLLTGTVTMVFPFLLMIAGSTKSAVDTPNPHVIPPFLVQERALYQKYCESLFNESIDALRFTYRVDAPSFARVELPPLPRPVLVQVWKDFLNTSTLPEYADVLGFTVVLQSRGVHPRNLRRFKSELITEYGDDLLRLNRELECQFESWATVYLRTPGLLLPSDQLRTTPLYRRLDSFKAHRPWAERVYTSVEGYFLYQFLQNRYGKSILDYNRTHGTAYPNWAAVHLDQRLPTGPARTDAERLDWLDFVRNLVNSAWVRLDETAAPAYREFLRAKYGDIGTLNRQRASQHPDFATVPLPAAAPAAGLARSDWTAFVQGWKDPVTGTLHQAAPGQLRLHSTEFLFHDYLRNRFSTVAAANAALGTNAAGWEDFVPPQQDLHYQALLASRAAWRWEFVSRNYVSVLEYVALRGRAVVNTAIYCGLLIGASLIVNPLAAYALSRYRPPSAYKVLLFLMLTMAFPPMVAQIPVFLMLREFNLLNTFWALILPGIANGYSIFLLKGFFDSLPRELYESAELDGASEFRIFWQLTMSLSKPILAVIALQAFTHAYANFMFALLICQDQQMWTLMPWLYQLQQRSTQGVIFASLLIASVPTFLLFIFCQKIIMRGIVVPVEK